MALTNKWEGGEENPKRVYKITETTSGREFTFSGRIKLEVLNPMPNEVQFFYLDEEGYFPILEKSKDLKGCWMHFIMT